MDGKLFDEAFDLERLRGKTILIDEMLPQSCDFLLVEMIKHFGYSLALYNGSSAHFRSLLAKQRLEGSVFSVYDEGNIPQCDIVDDVWTARNILKKEVTARVGVYRSGTARTLDYYGHDIVIRLSPLKSGCSSSIDGTIRMVARDNIMYEYKYKIFKDKILYYRI